MNVDNNGNVKTQCPIHGGDNHNAFSYTSKYKCWKCWTRHCHEKYGSTLFGLIQGINGWNYFDVCKFLYEITGVEPIDNVDSILTNDNFQINNFISKQKRLSTRHVKKPDIVYPYEIFSQKSHKVDYFLQRKFLQKTLDYFGAYYCDDCYQPMYQRACVPIINYCGQIVGVGGRLTYNMPDVPKWIYLPTNIQLRNHLYNLHNIPKPCDTIIVTEGILDVWRMYEAGIFNSVATFGSLMTNNQANLLLENNIQNIIIAFDPDQAGQHGVELIKDKFGMYFNIKNIVPLLKTDPGDYNPTDLKRLITGIN